MSAGASPGRYASIDEIVERLAAGEPVVLPTDTVYGIGCDPRSRSAVARVFEVKQRPVEKPLPILVADADAAAGVAVMTDAAVSLAEKFWPGPLTLVLARRPDQTLFVTPGAVEATIAVRVPDHELCRAVLARVGPLAVTSANRSGEPPAATAASAFTAFGGAIPVLDGGRVGGEPSTIISLVERPRLLRVGALTEAALTDAVGPLSPDDGG